MSDHYQRFVRTVCSHRYEINTLPWPEIVSAFQRFIAAAQELDQIKRAVFYGKSPADPIAEDGEILEANFEHIHQDAFHGIIGICTEAGELAERLLKMATEPNEPHRQNLIEEIGDVYWYTALLLALLGTNSAAIENSNMQKLMVRYDKITGFTQSAALSRNVSAEMRGLHSGFQTAPRS